MKRTPLVQERDVEILTEMDSSKGLNELRVNEGVNLYVEEKMTEEEFSQKKYHFQTRWENEFDVEKNSFNIRFNKIQEVKSETSPNTGATSGSTITAAGPETTKENIYTESVVIDKRSIVEDLKKAIALKLGESLDRVIIRRGGAHGAELVEDELNFKMANIYNMMSLYVERGEPTRVGYKRIRFYLVDYYNPDWNQLAYYEKNPE